MSFVDRPPFERQFCIAMNRFASRRLVLRFFATISRLGDGPFWYVLALSLPLIEGAAGWRASGALLLAAALTLPLYRVLKQRTRRPRPCADARITAWVAPLDEFSFPSGHTLHAVAFSLVAVAYFPYLAWVLAPFTALVAISRVILGLHYPSDVLAAIGIGWAISEMVLLMG